MQEKIQQVNTILLGVLCKLSDNPTQLELLIMDAEITTTQILLYKIREMLYPPVCTMELPQNH